MGYTNSPLVVYTKLSPNHSGQRTHSIDRITPHCVVGQLSAEASAAVLPVRAVRQVATTVSVQMAVCRFVSRKRTAAGVRPAMPMTRGRSPSNVPAI